MGRPFVCFSVCPILLAQNWCILGLWLLLNTNRKSHAGRQTHWSRGHRDFMATRSGRSGWGHMVNVMATSVERWQVPHNSKLYCLLPALV